MHSLVGALCRCSSDIFLSSTRPRTTTYITGYVWLRPDRLIDVKKTTTTVSTRYSYINRHAGTPTKHIGKRHDKLGLQLNLLHWVEDRMGVDEGHIQVMDGCRNYNGKLSNNYSYGTYLTPRALSLRNLVSGYERGRVLPAGVGPGLPSRDAANWLPSRFSLSVETRRRYGWLRMVFPGARLLRAPIWCPSAGSTVAESLVVLYQVGTHQIRRRRRAARSSTIQGRAELLCTRITGLNREVSEGKAHV